VDVTAHVPVSQWGGADTAPGAVGISPTEIAAEAAETETNIMETATTTARKGKLTNSV
jgi:hypothetical protein